MIVLDFFAGVIISALAGMGVGGGGLLVLYLVFVKGIEQIEAQGANLVFFIAAASASLIYHIRKRKINFKVCIILCLFGTLGAVAGSMTAYKIDPTLVRKIFGWLLIVSGCLTLLGKKKDTFLLWSVVALAFLFLVLSTTLITSLNKTDEEQRRSTYGCWQIMVSDSELTGVNLSEETEKILLTDDIISGLTSLSESSVVLPMVSVSGIDYFSGDNEYYITPFSEEFVKSGNLSLKEGKWPSEKNEIALEYARLSSLNLKLGDSFTVISQINIPGNDEYLARLDEIIELSKEDILNEGKDIYQRKAWNDFNPLILNFNKKLKTTINERSALKWKERQRKNFSIFSKDLKRPMNSTLLIQTNLSHILLKKALQQKENPLQGTLQLFGKRAIQ